MTTLTANQRAKLKLPGAKRVYVQGKNCGHRFYAVTSQDLSDGKTARFFCVECGSEQRARLVKNDVKVKRVCSDPNRTGCRAFLSQATSPDEDACSPCRLTRWNRDAVARMAEAEEASRAERIMQALPGKIGEVAERTGIRSDHVDRILRDLLGKKKVKRTGRPGRGSGRAKRVIDGYRYSLVVGDDQERAA